MTGSLAGTSEQSSGTASHMTSVHQEDLAAYGLVLEEASSSILPVNSRDLCRLQELQPSVAAFQVRLLE